MCMYIKSYKKVLYEFWFVILCMFFFVEFNLFFGMCKNMNVCGWGFFFYLYNFGGGIYVFNVFFLLNE